MIVTGSTNEPPTPHREAGDRLRRDRLAADITLRRMSELLGISMTELSKYESGREVAPEDVLTGYYLEIDIRIERMKALLWKAYDYLSHRPSCGYRQGACDCGCVDTEREILKAIKPQ